MTEPDVGYSAQASEALDKVEADAESMELWNALCDALDLIIDHPGSAAARRHSLRTAAGTTVWRVVVRVPRGDDEWSILWLRGPAGRTLIAFVGVL